MKSKFTKTLRFLFLTIIMLNLVVLPDISYALAPQSQIHNILKSAQLISPSLFHSFFFKQTPTFAQLYQAMNEKLVDISPDSLLNRLKHEISKKRIIPVLNDQMQISFKLANEEYDTKNLVWIFVPQDHMNKRIFSDGFVGSRSLKGTVLAVEKTLMRKNRFLENYIISSDESMLAYAHTSSLFRTQPKIFHNRKDKNQDIKTFHDIVNLFVRIQEEHLDDKKLMDNITNTFNVMYNMAQEGLNINSIFAAIFYNKDIRAKLSTITNIPEENLIEVLTNKEDAAIIKEKIEKATNLINYPYNPLPDAKHAFPNFLYSLVQQANLDSEKEPIFGEANLDILLLGLFNKIEEIDKQPYTEEDVHDQLTTLNTYGPLAEMLDKNYIADKLRNIYFRYNNATEYTALTTAIEKVFGMTYDQLTNHLECDIVNRLKETLKPLENNYNFSFRYRVKSLYSIWQKIKSKHTINPDEDLSSVIEKILRDGFLRKNGKERRLDDLYGLQVVFDIPHTLRSEEKMKEIQKKVLDLIDEEFKPEDSQDTFERRAKKLDKHGYREEKIMPIWKDKDGIEYRSEIQVLSDKDLKLYKHGAENGDIQAHWGYKIKEKGYVFDEEMLTLLKKLQYLYTEDSQKNFALLFEYLKKHIFTGVYHEEDEKNPAHMKHLRIPAKSIIADIASSESINKLKAKNAAQVTVAKDEYGTLQVTEQINILPYTPVKAGQIFKFGPAKDKSFAFGHHIKKIIEKAQKLSTVAQILPDDISSSQIFEAKTSLNDELMDIIKHTAPDIQSQNFVTYVTKSTLAFFKLNKSGELYRLAYRIKTANDHTILIRMGHHFFNDKLGQRMHITNMRELYAALKIPKQQRTPLRAFATMISADQIGRIKLHKQYRGNIDKHKDFNDIGSWVTRNALKKSSKRHGIKSLHQMRALIGIGLLSPMETMLEYYNNNFSYTLTLNLKDTPTDLYSLLMELEKMGIKHAPSIVNTPTEITLSLTSPSLTPSDREMEIINNKLQQVLSDFNINEYTLNKPSEDNKKMVKIIPHGKNTSKRLKKIFRFLGIRQSRTPDGAIIIYIDKNIPTRFMRRLLEEKLNTKRYPNRTFNITDLLQQVNFKALNAIRISA